MRVSPALIWALPALIWALGGCGGGELRQPPADAPVDDTAVEDTAAPVDTSTPTEEPTEEPYDCTQVPELPIAFHTLTGFSPSEDFDFDDQGYLGALYQGSLAAKNLAGDVKVISPNFGHDTAGTRFLATGDWAIADVGAGAMKLVDGATGGQSVILSGLAYPNGVEVDRAGYVYVAEQNAGRVRAVNAYDPDDNAIIATGLNNPNGVILSADETVMYVGSFGGGVVYAIDRLGDTPTGAWDTPRVIADNPGWDGGFDGINVDICGNVYFTEYLRGKVWVVTPSGAVATVADLPSSWIPNLRWGSGIDGWETDVLYVSDRNQGRIFGLELGIPGKPHVSRP